LATIALLLELEEAEMEERRVRHFQSLLEESRQNLLSRLGHVDENNGSNHDYGRDELDRAKSSEAQELFSKLSAQERHMLDAIERALRRVDEDTFGMCVVCQRQIDPKRLEAVPWALRCIQCQQRVES
jgi:DnaK suppressor protein